MLALFPGQGAQFVGMAKDLYDNFKVAQEVFEEASDATQLRINKLCFDGPESDLTLTEYTQPCLLTASIAAFRVAESEVGFRPSVVAGHSLGEYSALVAARAISLGTAAKWVRWRGAAMQRAVPPGEGTMAAVLGLEDEAVIKLCKQATAIAEKNRPTSEHAALSVPPVVEPANFNSPGQVVIAGSLDAVQAAVALIKSASEFSDGKAMLLNVSAPFHCSLMAPARSKMAEVFQNASAEEKPRDPICEYVPNRTARLTREPGLVFEMLIEQVSHPVLWKQSITALIEAGHTRAMEFGPGKVLQGLCKRISVGGKNLTVIGCGDTAAIRALENGSAT